MQRSNIFYVGLVVFLVVVVGAVVGAIVGMRGGGGVEVGGASGTGNQAGGVTASPMLRITPAPIGGGSSTTPQPVAPGSTPAPFLPTTQTSPPTPAPTPAPIIPGVPTPIPTAAPTSVVFSLVSQFALQGGAELQDPNSYQAKAVGWLEGDVGWTTTQQLKQRYVLSCLWFATNGVSTIYTDGEFGVGNPVPGWTTTANWMTSQSECNWHGVTCRQGGIIRSVQLDFNSMSGKFPAEISLLKDQLTFLDVSDNFMFNQFEELNFLGELTQLSKC